MSSDPDECTDPEHSADDILFVCLAGKVLIFGLRKNKAFDEHHATNAAAKHAGKTFVARHGFLAIGCVAFHPSIIGIKRAIIDSLPDRMAVAAVFRNELHMRIVATGVSFEKTQQTFRTLRPDVVVDTEPLVYSAGVPVCDSPE